MPFENQVKLLLEIDEICDGARDESTLALQLVAYLAETINVELAAFSLPDEQQPDTWKLQAVSDRGELLSKISMTELTAVADAATVQGNNNLIELSLTLPSDMPTSYVLAAPQYLNGETLGVLLLCQLGEKFSDRQRRLVEIASTRMDSALRHIRILQQFEQEAVALRTVLQVDRIRDTSHSMDEMLDRSLSEVTAVISAQAGFIMLYDRQGNRLELRAITEQSFADSEETFQQLYKFADEAIQLGDVLHWSPQEGKIQAIMGVPLILNERVVGVLGVINPLRRQIFTKNDRRLLVAIASQMDTAIFERMETQRVREVFGRNVGAKVMNRLLNINDRDLLQGERVEITILFSDIRGFTAVSANTDPVLMESVINMHFQSMVEVVYQHEGTLDKFLGDGLMAFFNAPERQPQHASLAIKAALEMQRVHAKVQAGWQQMGLAELPIGIGIATGEVVVGNFGSRAHAEYSAIGSTVNLAARLCEDASGGQILINERMVELAGDEGEIISLPPVILKGFSDPMPVWEIREK